MPPEQKEAKNATRTAFGADYEQRIREEAGDEPEKKAKRKHQIHSLYHQAKMKVGGLYLAALEAFLSIERCCLCEGIKCLMQSEEDLHNRQCLSRINGGIATPIHVLSDRRGVVGGAEILIFCL